VPLEPQPVLRAAVGPPRDERQDVDAHPAAPQGVQRRLGIVQEVVTLGDEAGDADEPAPDVKVLTANLHARLRSPEPRAIPAGRKRRIDSYRRSGRRWRP